MPSFTSFFFLRSIPYFLSSSPLSALRFPTFLSRKGVLFASVNATSIRARFAFSCLRVRHVRTLSDQRNPVTRKFYRRPTDGCCSTNRKLYEGELIRAREPAIPRYEIPWRATEMLQFSECTARLLIYDT